MPKKQCWGFFSNGYIVFLLYVMSVDLRFSIKKISIICSFAAIFFCVVLSTALAVYTLSHEPRTVFIGCTINDCGYNNYCNSDGYCEIK